jgi:hypothetical protein
MTNTIFHRLQKLPISSNFSIAFFSILIIRLFWLLYNPTLENFDGRMISEATLEGFDITTRIQFFTKSIFLFLFTFFILYQIKSFCNRLNGSVNYLLECIHIHYLSLFGLMLLFFQINGFKNTISIIYILAIQLFYCMALFLKFAFQNYKQCNNAKRTIFYLFCILLAILLYFIIQSTLFYNASDSASQLILIPFLSFILLLVLNIWLKKVNRININKTLKTLIYALLPVMFTPLLNIFSTEIFFFINAHGYLSSQLLNYLILLIGLLILSLLRWKRFKGREISLYPTIAKYHLPAFVFSIAAFIAYNPIIKISGEMFESGNELLPIMEFHKFGVVPTIEKFNSHMLSEIIFPLFYSFIHKTWNYDVLIYGFFHYAIYALIIYYFIYKYFSSVVLAILALLCFPLMNAFIPLYHTMALILIFALNTFLKEEAKFKNYMLLFGLLIFMIAWRIDIGYPSLVAALFVLFLFFIKTKHSFFNLKYLIYSVCIFAILGIVLLSTIALIRNIDLIEKLRSTLSYFSSAQTYGHLSLGDANTFVFKLHYFIFPTSIVLLLTFLILKFSYFTDQQNKKEQYIALIFLIVYYIMNFQRGLVRHSLIEGDDLYTSSFIYLIIALSIILLSTDRFKNSSYITLVLFMPLIIMACKVPMPDSTQKNILEVFHSKINPFHTITEKEAMMNRVDKDSDETQKKYGNLISFFKTKLSGNQTFIDFSNTPMLYYFTGKLSPSDFYQNPLTIHNDDLQNNFIKNLPNYNVPYLLFGKVNEDFFDIVDGVPNTMRHYKMAEYFYTHYKPYRIIDGFRVWKQIDNIVKVDTNTLYADSLESIPKTYDIKMLPFIWGQYDKSEKIISKNYELQIAKTTEDTIHYFLIPENCHSNTKNTLTIQMSSRRDANIYLEYGDTTSKNILGAYKFLAPSMRGEIPFNIRIGTQYNWYNKKISYIKIKSDIPVNITKINLSESE